MAFAVRKRTPMNGLTITVYDMVTYFPHAIDVFDRYNLDYFCNGSRSFLTACDERNIDVKRVWEEIRKTEYGPRSMARSLEELNPEILANLILGHYSGISGRIPDLTEVLARAADQSLNEEHEKIESVRECFNQLSESLVAHAASEELVLLQPWESRRKATFLAGQLTAMEHEHSHIGLLVTSLRQLTASYSITDLQSSSVNLAWIMLRQFDKELTQRLHLENNILFPKLKAGINGGGINSL